MRYIISISLIAICGFLGGCGIFGQQPYGGGTSGSAAIPGDYSKHYAYVFQYDKTERKPLFVIFWIKTNGTKSGSKMDYRSLTTEINGRPITPSLSRKAAYALQQDYSLKEIALTNEEIDHLFKVDEDDKDSIAHDKLFQSKVVPNLKLVDK